MDGGRRPPDSRVRRILEYVILDVTGRRVEIRRPKGEEWGETLILTEDGEFTPLGASGPIRVADLIPEV